MPINSYIPPQLMSPVDGSLLANEDATGHLGDPEQAQSTNIQRLNSHSSQASDRRRRGSSLGNFFSSFTSTLRQQGLQLNPQQNPQLNAQASMSTSPGLIPHTSSSASLASSFNGTTSNLSHQPSNMTMRPSLPDSRRSSTTTGNQATTGISSQSLSLAMSPTVTDIQDINVLNRSSSSLNRRNSTGQDLVQTDELMDTMDDIYEESEELARTRHNSTLVTPLLEESVAEKREADGSFSIRLTPYIDHSSSSPALYFSPLIRKLKPGLKLPIGRYTDRNREAVQAPPGSSAPVVFKSKVVSRTHLEIFVDDNGVWFIKDLKSSSGTFLNHIRLSPAGIESEDRVISDGDILQLGMDFRGGSEEIYRCVKVRVELNKSWKRKTHKFNKDAHKKLLGEETECCICLNDLRVGDSIFISPCSHSWHYKCVRPLLVKNYPQFHCPNCRAITDLEEDDDDED